MTHDHTETEDNVVRVTFNSMEQECVDEVVPFAVDEDTDIYHSEGDYVLDGVTENEIRDAIDALYELERDFSGGMHRAAQDASSAATKLSTASTHIRR